MAMNSRVKALWLEALRSSQYRQTSGQLKKRRGTQAMYCCLGVLSLCGLSEGPGTAHLSRQE